MAQSLGLLSSRPTVIMPSKLSSSIPSMPSLRPSFPCPRRLHALSVRAASSVSPDLGVIPFDGAATSPIDVDKVTESELKENGFRSTRRTKLVCTIGPATCSPEQIEALAVGGMNVARINMCHGTHEWHHEVIRQVRRLNEEKGFAVAVMMDTEGSEIHMGDLGGAASAKAEVRFLILLSLVGEDVLLHFVVETMRKPETWLVWADGEIWTFSVRAFNSPRPERTIIVNYDGFAEDVRVGDLLLVDGGMVRFEVIEKIGPDVKCRCIDPGLLLPRANLTFWRNSRLVRERNAMLPTISSKVDSAPHDWLDIDFGISEGVDFIAVSFVKSAEVINHLKSYIAARCRDK
ncbi:hypothetical protein ZIOFF_057482 [Zingiber officinale]|uniref:pyruvate kinase n=1 Tax=Zingiber officinale TaxID=94328 RepID=A0A8J5FCK3_ZINOF|nr:hypothetical protein ZIOFF_057482 [Zingiber officinale]